MVRCVHPEVRVARPTSITAARWARYTAPDLVRHAAPGTFDTRGDAETWLAMRRSVVARGVWNLPQNAPTAVTFGAYADESSAPAHPAKLTSPVVFAAIDGRAAA